jgi:hypothetical protein
MRAQTRQQKPARPEARCLTVLFRIAKSKFRPRENTAKSIRHLSHPALLVRLERQEILMRRTIAAILAILNIGNGLAMLFAGPYWFQSVPGAAETGAFNPHFVQDIGAAFLVAGLALAARAWQPAWWPAAVAGAGYLVLHGLIHQRRRREDRGDLSCAQSRQASSRSRRVQRLGFWTSDQLTGYASG